MRQGEQKKWGPSLGGCVSGRVKRYYLVIPYTTDVVAYYWQLIHIRDARFKSRGHRGKLSRLGYCSSLGLTGNESQRTNK